MTGEPRVVSRVAAGCSSYDGEFRLPLVLSQGSPIFHSSCEGELGVALESLQGIRDLIYSCVQDLMFLSRGDRELGVTLQTHPGSQSSYQGVAKNSALLSSHDGYLLEPTERPKGSQASSGVWREDSGLLIRPCRKRRPSSRDDGGVSWVFLNCSASVGFLARYDGELRERLVWRRGSQVSLWLARRCASLLSSHGRGVRPQDALKKDSQGLSRVAAGNPGFPQLMLVTSGRFSGCL